MAAPRTSQGTSQVQNVLYDSEVEIDDMELVARFQEGCSQSFELLLSRYETKIHNLATRLTRNSEDAEEVLQDVFLTVYRKVDSFEGKSKFSSWLYRVTVNAAFMKLRKRRQDKTLPLDEAIAGVQTSLALVQHTAEQASADCRALTLEMRASLEGAIKKLPEEYRAVFILRDIDGLSNKEVADILTLSIPAVKSRLHRSRLMLRKRLRKVYDDFSQDSQGLGGSSLFLQSAA